MADLETVDIPAVEILASGGPVKAIGSPPEGDFYTRDELEAIAAAHRELGSEIRAPIKLGHSDRQQLLANSGLTKGEMPAAGWLDSASFRVEDDPDTGVAKLLADARSVPKKIGDLMTVGAYRTRSSEIRQYASQATQKTYDWVVNGLALLGEQIPAIQTLDDVYRLYERAGIDKPEADTFVVRRQNAVPDLPEGVTSCSMKGVSGYSGGFACHVHDGSDTGKATALAKAKADAVKQRQNAAPVWDVEDGLEDIRGDLNDALNPAGYDLPGVPSLWVRDVARSSTVALVSQGWGDNDDAWVVPFTLNDDGTVTVAPRSEWKAAEQTWIAASNDLARKNHRPAESRRMEITLTDEQAAAVREQLGITAEADITPDSLVEAAEARANELAEAKKTADEAARKLQNDDTAEQLRKLEADLETEKKRSFEQRRDAAITEALRTRELEPADVEKWERRFEALGEETTVELLDELPKRSEVREFGRDDDGTGTQTEEQRRNENAELNEIFPGADLRAEATS